MLVTGAIDDSVEQSEGTVQPDPSQADGAP